MSTMLLTSPPPHLTLMFVKTGNRNDPTYGDRDANSAGKAGALDRLIPPMTKEQIAALIRALEMAKAGYAPERNDFYLGIMHGMQRAIDIVRRAAHPLNAT